MAHPLEWPRIDLVVFDLDGTLYNQSVLRRKMMADLLYSSARSRNITILRIISKYRALREEMGDFEVEDFPDKLVSRTSNILDVEEQMVRDVVEEWINVRPLKYLRSCMTRGCERLFSALHARQRLIGIWSDYPAEEKIRALGLRPDFIVSSEDADVKMLKPNPRGLHRLMDLAGVPAARTLMVGDREDRDGEAARRADVSAAIRSKRRSRVLNSFCDFDDPLFGPLYEA
jgi:HAD superfamily hydrolase (TIGR01549 family)